MKINWKILGAHLLFWLLYIVIWGIHDLAFAPTFWDTVEGNVIGSLWYAVGVYINLYLLIPYLLLKNKRWAYVGLVILLMLLVSYGLAQTFAWHYLSIHKGTSDFFASVQGIANTASDFLVVYGLATCLFFINEWYIKERKLRELESQNLKAELVMLKGQINPHFLFNALNSVHVLIRTNPELATDTLEKFSDLLSHQLYDVEQDKITLSQEVQNLDNFIELQKMRHKDHVDVDWSYTGSLEGRLISPMLFLNFVENAFKHGSANGDEHVKVEISLSLAENQLSFVCSNSASEDGREPKSIGLGIANVRRRLDIIYPDKYQLSTGFDEGAYRVLLKLDISEA
ncbi:sensor histidine kinase [Roseivirga sp. E12]|uniref:sensor histidine kinase n=1 Tax=Roseivirga sp. E12 TaxID=2819237 RepID=UPI001ABCAA22|nr:histidine kinase [Roseivirga sp. E12]MBO3698535.1 histidine kinase [Roseivirga sp. E12]